MKKNSSNIKLWAFFDTKTQEGKKMRQLTVTYDSERDFRYLRYSMGYSGHSYDLPLTWLRFTDSKFNLIIKAYERILFKIGRQIQKGIDEYHEKWNSEEAEFYDQHAAGHSRCIYKLVKFKIKKNQCFFSEQNNEKFVKLAKKIAEKS